jgi:hypothetical protein
MALTSSFKLVAPGAAHELLHAAISLVIREIPFLLRVELDKPIHSR